MDVVYMLGPDRAWDDRPLFFSCLGVLRKLTHVDKVWVVGEKPRIRLPIPYIHVYSPNTGSPTQNVNGHLLRVCQQPDLSSSFLRMDDDVFFRSDMDAEKIPCYCKGPLRTTIETARPPYGADYKVSLLMTEALLEDWSCTTMDYEVHGPIAFEKDKLRPLLEALGDKDDILIRSTYCNVVGAKTEFFEDCKIREPLAREVIEGVVRSKPFFSVGGSAWNMAMKCFVGGLYK